MALLMPRRTSSSSLRRAFGVHTQAVRTKSICTPLHRPLTAPTLDEFAMHLRLENEELQPLLLPYLVKSGDFAWPAVKSWPLLDQEGRETLAGLRNDETDSLPVEVEVGRRGRGYFDAKLGAWRQLTMPFGLFLDAFVLRSIPSTDPSSRDIVGYLAQQDLLSRSSTLAASCPPLPHTRAGPRGDREQWRCNTWIGPADTFTPLHRDPYENLFVQVVGRKRVHLFPPTSAPHLYLQDSGTQPNTSVVPAERPLLQSGLQELRAQYPALQEAATHPGACHTVLEAGDALFIPRGWLHCVSSLTTSVSINFWWR